MTDTDPRVTCTHCQHMRGGWFQRAQQAGLSTKPRAEVGHDFATLPQHCSGHQPIRGKG